MGRRGYIFDMDGTLVDNVQYHVKAWKAFSRKYGNELSEDKIVGWMGMTNRVYQERILGRPVGDEESLRMSVEFAGLADSEGEGHDRRLKLVYGGAPLVVVHDGMHVGDHLPEPHRGAHRVVEPPDEILERLRLAILDGGDFSLGLFDEARHLGRRLFRRKLPPLWKTVLDFHFQPMTDVKTVRIKNRTGYDSSIQAR